MVANYKAIINDIIKYATEENIPIMQKEGIIYLTDYIVKHDVKNVLEIGTAIGFSAIMMAISKEDIHITTIEKDEGRYLEAIKNIKKMELEDKITLIFNDALNTSLEDKYDLIFIDAAKSKNTDLFQKYELNLTNDGTIITDNMNFHGLVDKDESEISSRNLRGLVRKVKAYHEFLENNPKYVTEFSDAGDGLAISRKKEFVENK
ncbi:MAG: O-methyltransferase [Bacilli bacterium]|nr:O-methyltransferase [Bacilli bacterium]